MATNDGSIESQRHKYIIGFTVHEARELSREGVAIDPLVVVRALGREYKTQLKRDKLQHVKWEESFIWSDVWLTESEFNMSFIEFELQSACIFVRNEVVGIGKVQLAMVRKRPNHTYSNKTLQLSNSTELTAKMKVTVFCYGEGDDPPRPEDEANDFEDVAAQFEDLGAAVMGAAGTDKNTFTQAYHLFVQVHRAEHLGGDEHKYNPYVQCEFNGCNLQLPPAKNTNTVTFDECFRMPVVTPLFADSILIRVWDKHPWGQDEVIVQGRLSFSLLRMHALQPKWFNFYGFSKKEVRDVGALTGTGEAAEANAFMGRLLISGRVQKVGSVEELHRPAVVKGQIMEEPPCSSMTLITDVFEVSGCPGLKTFVSMAVGTKNKRTKSSVRNEDCDPDYSKPGRFSYKDGRGRMDSMTCMMPADPENQLDILISIWAELGSLLPMNQEFQRIGFKRVKVSEVQEWKGDAGTPVWVACHPMAHLPTSIEPGAVLMTIFKSAQQVKDRGMMNVKPLKFELRAYCCMARNLVSLKKDQLPNPHCQISCAGSTAQTVSIRSTTAPAWSTCLQIPIELQCSLGTLKVHPEPIQVVVFDEEDPDALMSAVNHLRHVGHAAVKLMEEEANDGADAAKIAEKTKEEMAHLSAASGVIADNGGVSKLGAKAVQGMQDIIGDLAGDVMARKRLGAVVGGRRVIGRTQVHIRKLLRPNAEGKGMHPKWIKLKGGMMGAAHVGDILIGFELMKTKYAPQIPVKNTQPPSRECTLSVSLLGLRHVKMADDLDLGKPKLCIVGPNMDGDPVTEVIEWTKKPSTPATGEDVNRKWHKNGRGGYEFLNVIHMKAVLPKSATYEPDLRFRIYAGHQDVATSDPIAEGRWSLAERLPWVKQERARAAIQAHEEYAESDVGDAIEGVQVSDAEDNQEDIVDYVDVEVGNEPIKVAFNYSDTRSFPPVVSNLASDSSAKKRGIKKGDWLVGYKTPTDQGPKLTGIWTPAQASDFVAKMDKDRVRPLLLRFRKKDRTEVTTWLLKDTQKLGLKLVGNEHVKPPQIKEDLTTDGMWKKHGVKPGWYIVDINGVDLQDMSSTDQKFLKLLAMRPACITCRPFGKPGQGAAALAAQLAEEKNFQQGKAVMLDGLPTKLVKEQEHKMKQQDGCLRCTSVPRPSVFLPPVTEVRYLNMRAARAGLLDVRGVIKPIIGGRGDGDEGDEKSRPSVPGTLEEFMEGKTFYSVPLIKGGEEVGIVKMTFKVVFPMDMVWVRKLKDRNHPDLSLFEERFMRQKFKLQQPATLRVRTYVIRGLNVSGFSTGYGNPYLFFHYGSHMVQLEGHRQLATVEPRFFRTEERDVSLPEEGIFEVGLYDWSGTGNDQMIGKTIIDLEDRWYTPTFQGFMKNHKVPIEYRPLVNPDGHICKGSLEMWVEILDAQDAAEVPTSALFQPPPVEVEVRVVIWTARNISRKLCVDEFGEEREKIDCMARCAIECRTFAGPQPKEQETDIHYSCDGEAEYNWRFIFSRIQVTRGVNLDCFVQLSLWENFALKRPTLLCESMVDMKNYCKKVSNTRTQLQIEAELPLTSQQLTELLEKEGEDEVEEEEEEEEENEEQAKKKNEIPPAALMKVMVQVIPQTEASMGENKAGLGRGEPNVNPVLTYPTSGRTWQHTLPTAAVAIEAVIETFHTGKRRGICMLILLFFVGIIVALHYFKDPNTQCPYIQKSCRSQKVCPKCYFCNHLDKPDASFCFYAFLSDADKTCAGVKADNCNMQDNCECEHDTCDVATDCSRTPNSNDGTSSTASSKKTR